MDAGDGYNDGSGLRLAIAAVAQVSAPALWQSLQTLVTTAMVAQGCGS